MLQNLATIAAAVEYGSKQQQLKITRTSFGHIVQAPDRPIKAAHILDIVAMLLAAALLGTTLDSCNLYIYYWICNRPILQKRRRLNRIM